MIEASQTAGDGHAILKDGTSSGPIQGDIDLAVRRPRRATFASVASLRPRQTASTINLRLAETSPTGVRVDFNLDDTLTSLEALLDRWSSANIPDDAPSTIDLTNCRYLGPLGVSVLGSLQLTRATDARLSLTPPLAPPQLLAYCQWAGLLELFSAGPGPAPHPDNVTTPLRIFSERPQSQMDEVVDLVTRTMPWPDAAVKRLQITLAELAQNVVDHARSSVGGLLSARAFKNEREVRFVVADRGVGFREALLRNNIASSDDTDAIRRALNCGVTSRSSTHNMGQGLKTLVGIVQKNEGRLLLVSRSGYLDLHGNRRDFGRLGHPFPGSLALIRLKMGKAEATERVTDVW